MRQRLMVLLVLAVSLLLVIAAVPAAAKKGGGKGPPDRSTEQAPGVTCTWAETGKHWDDLYWDTNENPIMKTDDFTFTLTKDQGTACYDILTSLPGRWFITAKAVNGSGARSMTIVPRDAVGPGDSCGGVGGLRGDDFEAPIPLPWFDDANGNGVQDPGEEGDTRFSEIPAATVNACIGNDEEEPIWGQFGEWFDWDGDGEFDFDPVTIGGEYPEALQGYYPLGEKVMQPIDYEHPLVLLVFSGGYKRNGATEMCVDLPPTGDGICYQP